MRLTLRASQLSHVSDTQDTKTASNYYLPEAQNILMSLTIRAFNCYPDAHGTKTAINQHVSDAQDRALCLTLRS